MNSKSRPVSKKVVLDQIEASRKETEDFCKAFSKQVESDSKSELGAFRANGTVGRTDIELSKEQDNA